MYNLTVLFIPSTDDYLLLNDSWRCADAGSRRWDGPRYVICHNIVCLSIMFILTDCVGMKKSVVAASVCLDGGCMRLSMSCFIQEKSDTISAFVIKDIIKVSAIQA